MPQRYDKHSRIVAWLKVVLPLAALAILSTLFLISRSIDPSDAIPYAEVDVADRIREPRMTEPSYAGVTSDGAMLTITAAEARPDSATTSASAKGLHASLATPDGASTRFSATTLDLNTGAGRLNLGGGVQVTTSNGYTIDTEALTLALDKTGMQSQGAITAEGPLGKLAAGVMTLREDSATPGAYLLVFNNHVTLIYQPH